MKKIIIFCALIVFLAGCGKSVPDVEKMKQDFSADERTIYVDDVPYVLQLDSLDILKRQTDDREDKIWCSFVLSGGVYKLEGTVELKYEYYDEGGWLIEDIYISDENLSITNDELPDFMQRYTMLNSYAYYSSGNYIDTLDMQYTGHINNEQNDYHRFEYSIYNDEKYCIEEGTYSIDWALKKMSSKNYRWKYEEHADVKRTWQNITGVYESIDNKTKIKVTIDSFDEQANKIHIAYLAKDVIELDDLTIPGKSISGTTADRLSFYQLDREINEKLKNGIYRNEDGWRVSSLGIGERMEFYRDGRVVIGNTKMEKVEE